MNEVYNLIDLRKFDNSQHEVILYVLGSKDLGFMYLES